MLTSVLNRLKTEQGEVCPKCRMRLPWWGRLGERWEGAGTLTRLLDLTFPLINYDGYAMVVV